MLLNNSTGLTNNPQINVDSFLTSQKTILERNAVTCNEIAKQILILTEEQKQLKKGMESDRKKIEKISNKQNKLRKQIDDLDDFFIFKIYYTIEKAFKSIGAFFRSFCNTCIRKAKHLK